ncbi:DinB family protein [Nocardioides currus]|uniref:DinB family protein n=1 Tax=Nocardioides currus TaxID=2133958 RepID=A0A2R7YZT8_9ACTN|nr:DinB family protein [Nocardioides currus]PUA81895.1 DinB family protein [Nocardioides currus]
MTRYVDEDLSGAEFRECDLSNARLVGVVMQDAVIDGLVTNLTVNGVEVMAYVEAELDRRQPVRLLLRSDDPADLRRGWSELRAAWAATADRLRQSPGLEHASVNDEWSAVQTLRHLVFVHDSWFRRCCLGSTEPFTSIGLGIESVPDREEQGLDPTADPTLDEVLTVRAEQAAELEGWLAGVTPGQLREPAPVPDDGRWPPYATGRTLRQCLGTVLGEELEHHGFCVRDLDLIDQTRV